MIKKRKMAVYYLPIEKTKKGKGLSLKTQRVYTNHYLKDFEIVGEFVEKFKNKKISSMLRFTIMLTI